MNKRQRKKRIKKAMQKEMDDLVFALSRCQCKHIIEMHRAL
jgi:hypothetical protein